MKTAPCAWCAKLFRFRPNKTFCSASCRFSAWKHGLEKCAKPCYYCGLAASTVDHVPPRSVRPILVSSQESRWPFVEVDACRECNTYLGAAPPWTLPERKAKIKERLKRRYSRILKIPDWSDAEMREMEGTNLGKYIYESVVLKKLIQQRLGW